MHGRVVGELGGDERVVSSVGNGRVTMEEDTVSLGSYLFSQTQPTSTSCCAPPPNSFTVSLTNLHVANISVSRQPWKHDKAERKYIKPERTQRRGKKYIT